MRVGRRRVQGNARLQPEGDPVRVGWAMLERSRRCCITSRCCSRARSVHVGWSRSGIDRARHFWRPGGRSAVRAVRDPTASWRRCWMASAESPRAVRVMIVASCSPGSWVPVASRSTAWLASRPRVIATYAVVAARRVVEDGDADVDGVALGAVAGDGPAELDVLGRGKRSLVLDLRRDDGVAGTACHHHRAAAARGCLLDLVRGTFPNARVQRGDCPRTFTRPPRANPP